MMRIRMGKLLKLSFVILVLVTVGELGYYVYALHTKGKVNKTASLVPPITPLSTLSNPTPSPEKSLRAREATVLSQIAKNYQVLEKQDNEKYYLIHETEGNIDSLELADPSSPSGDLIIKIVDRKGNRLTSLLTKKILADNIFWTKEGYLEKPIKIDNVKKGDKVVERVVYDMETLKRIEAKYYLMK